MPTTPPLSLRLAAVQLPGVLIPLQSVFQLPWLMPRGALAFPFRLFKNWVALAILPPRLPPGVRWIPLALMPSPYLLDFPIQTSSTIVLDQEVSHILSPMGLTTSSLLLIVVGTAIRFQSIGGESPSLYHIPFIMGGVTFDSLGHHVPSAEVPSFVFGGANVPGAQGLRGYSHALSSVASSFGALSSTLCPLPHQDARSLLDSNISQSFGLPGQLAPPDVTPVPPVDLPGAPVPVLPPSTPSSSTRLEPFKLVDIKDAKAYLDNYDLIQYYLCISEFLTGRLDGVLQMDPSNAEASRIWEGQICMAIKDGSLCFLFENKGDLFHGRGFEMLATLDQHCCPNTISNAFSSLLSLFNEVQGDNELILEY